MYQGVVATLGNCKENYICNATADAQIYIELDSECELDIVSEFGEALGNVTLDKGIHKISVPVGGYAKVVKK